MKSILCFGDSNTYGFDPVTKGRFERSVRWTGALADMLGGEYFVVEEGLCGRTTVFEDMIRPNRNGSLALPMLLESHSPDILIIMLGTNDCKTVYNATADIIAEGARTLIRQAKSFRSDIKVLLISPILLADGVGEDGFDPEFGERSVEVSRGLKEAYREAAQQEGVGFMAASDFAAATETDREHMEKAEHRLLAEAVCNAVRAIGL